MDLASSNHPNSHSFSEAVSIFVSHSRKPRGGRLWASSDAPNNSSKNWILPNLPLGHPQGTALVLKLLPSGHR